MPVIAEEHKTFYPCCLLCCFKSNPLAIIASVPSGGYTPGQIINVQIEVNNQSDQLVSNFTVQLIKVSRVSKNQFDTFSLIRLFFAQQIRYQTHKSNSKKKLETVVLSEEIAQGCDLNCATDLCVNVVVPSVSPTDNTTSEIIQFEYSVRVR